MDALNLYGDERRSTKAGFGVDVAAQRADDLDNLALEYIRSLGGRVRAIDAASASGGQAVRMAAAGALTTAIDRDDYAEALRAAAAEAGVADRCNFAQCDLIGLDFAAAFPPVDVVVCQRMLHYVPASAALEILKSFRAALTPTGRLFVSASGLHSELGEGYGHRLEPLAARYAPLEAAVADKHDIRGPVCLYTEKDLSTLLGSAGFTVERIFSSPFGNIKAVAKP